MSTTANEIWLTVGAHRTRLDLDDETQLLPTFQANDRTKPDTIQADYSPEFSAPGTAHNHRLLRQAAASQPVPGQAYTRLPCVLTSGGVETLPLGLLYVKGYKEGRYQLQLAGGNRRLIEALGDKKLSDLNLNRFNHNWTPANIQAGLPYAHWQSQGWGYEVYERGKPLDLEHLDPYGLYPSVADSLIWQQILTDAGFTADALDDAFAASLNVPSANPYEFSQAYRDARQLTAGYFYRGDAVQRYFYYHSGGFAQEGLNFSCTSLSPYHAPEATTGASYFAGVHTVDTLGYYNIAAAVPTFFGCNDKLPGKVRVKFMLLVNGQHVFDDAGNELGKDEAETGKYVTQTFAPKLTHYLLHPGDKVQLVWQGDEIGGTFGINPSQPIWGIGPYGSIVPLAGSDGLFLSAEVKFTVDLLPEFPAGGLVKLQEWLPDLKQLDYVKARMLLLGLTIQCDAYEPHLHLATGAQLLTNVPQARNWTAKRHAYAPLGRPPERELVYRFGSYGQLNYLKWLADEHVTPGYGDGVLAVLDQVLPPTADIATLPFAATERSPVSVGLLRILNFEVQDLTATPPTYTLVQAKPRITLRRPDGEFSGHLVMVPATSKVVASLAPFTTTPSYFAGADLTLLLNGTVLTTYWADVRAMLDEARYLIEYYRLTPQDMAELDFSVPIWDGLLGDFFAVSQVSEYDARRPVEVRLCRLNATHLGPPTVPGDGVEFWSEEFETTNEFY